MPNPNAHPEYIEGSMPPAFNTFGWTIPVPPSSSQPDLQILHLALATEAVAEGASAVPLHTVQVISTSKDGSVN